jgi:sugar lactone lactonase YvrE
MKTPLRFVILFISFAFLGISCKKTTTTNDPPALTTNDVVLDVTSTTAQSGGTITSIGSSAITANGVCYSSNNKTPTISDLKTTDPIISTSYSYTSNITGLNPSTTYYLRAYATNAYGTSYGSVVTFSTTATSSTIAGAVTTFAGSATGGYADGLGAAAQFNNPIGMAIDAQGNIYVSDSFNNRIRKIAPDGTVTTIAGNGIAGYLNTDAGNAANAEFYGPQGLAVDAQGNIFVADFGNNVIREIATTGAVTTFAGNGTAGYVDGTSSAAEFNGPAGLAFDKQGNLYVADNNNNMIRKITSAGVVSRVAGTKTPGYVNGTVNTTTGVYTSFRAPNGLVVDVSGNIFVADLGNSAIRQITSAGIVTTIAGGPGQTSLLGSPAALAMDASGNFFITDESGRIVELTSGKILYDLAGAANVTGFADGTGTAARFNTPQGICVDASGNIFVSDFNNNRIRKVVIVAVNNQSSN